MISYDANLPLFFSFFLSFFLSFHPYSIRVFSISAIVCCFIVLPVNYYGRMSHQHIPSESLESFTILNVQEGSKWYALYTVNETKS